MASVTSLDQDMRSLRLSRYTPQAANEARTWIEQTLGEKLPPGDFLDVLKDGVALCKLANLVVPYPGVKYKNMSMSFVQMENISHFLKACELAPLSMPAHDRFLTVDLYESKDPAQVLQCLSAFSRQAHSLKPSVVTTTIGPKRGNGALSPTATGTGAVNGSRNGTSSITFARPASPSKFSSALPTSDRALTPSLTGGSTGSNSAAGAKPFSGPTSSWSRKADEGNTAPAWNIHQYGYMGGASQGNQGISFGARRQITSPPPAVPNMAEKERLRKEKAAEDLRLRAEAEAAEERRRKDLEDEEARAKVDEEARWQDETRRARDEERRQMEEQKRRWAEQERKWKEEEAIRKKEDAEIKAQLKRPPEKPRVPSSSILRGQTLSQYQKEQADLSKGAETVAETPEQKRVRELEKQLEEARERERQYQDEREERLRRDSERSRVVQVDGPQPDSAHESRSSWAGDEREQLRQQWQSHQQPGSASAGAQVAPSGDFIKSQPSSAQAEAQLEPIEDRSTPAPALSSFVPQALQVSDSASTLPTVDSGSEPPSSPPTITPQRPTASNPYNPSPPSQPETRTDRFLSTNQAPSPSTPRISASQEAGDTSLEQSLATDTRTSSQRQTKAGGWASKSLLEREMERERERQREWEANQSEIKGKTRDVSQGGGEGQSWDVNQYGFMGGDGMNRGSSAGSGINVGGRRQIIGPREMTPKKG